MNKKEELELTIETLKSIRTRTKGEFGICMYFTLCAGEGLDSYVLTPYFRSWNKFSGCTSYPVPSGVGDDRHSNVWLARTAFDAADEGDMWNKATQYGSDRHELLEHCIQEATKELRTYVDE